VISRIEDGVTAVRGRVGALRQRHALLRHADRAGRRYFAQRGSHLASAVAFATVLAAVPLMMVLFSAAAYVLWWRPSLTAELEAWIVEAAPAPIDEVVQPAVDAAIAQRGSIASVGLLAAVWAGATWVAVVREAVSAMWGLPPLPPAAPSRILRDLRSLLLLLVAFIISVVSTVVAGTALSSTLGVLGLSDHPGIRSVLAVAGVLLPILISWSVLAWILARLPRTGLTFRSVVGPAAAGAVALELLTVAVTVTVGSAVGSVGGALFGTALAALAFLYATGRILLMLAAWTATADSVPGRPAPGRPLRP
jgi:membrane protein